MPILKQPLKLKSLPNLLSKLKKEKAKGKKIVFTNGCFDILHVGHVRYLREARSLGDILVVGINSDASVKQLKGPNRPVNKENDRAEVLGALECVQYTSIFRGQTPYSLIGAIRPDYLVKGGDWKKKDIVGADIVESYGGKVISLKFVKGFSTSRVIDKINKK
jgi:D-glycero-beta-D-manno-heptose 1-phosphate adenylyltransferase